MPTRRATHCPYPTKRLTVNIRPRNNTLFRALRNEPRDAWLLYLGRFTRDTGRGLLAVLAVLYLREIGIGNAQIGLLLGISLAGGFVTSLAVMLFATRFTARTWAAVIATVTSIAGIVLIATDQYFPLLIGGFFGSYAASGVHWGPMLQVEQTGLSNLSQDRHRTRSFSFLNIASSIGRALGALLAGGATLLVAAYEFELVDAYRIMLAVYCVLNFVSAGGYLFLSSAPDGRNSSQQQHATIQNPFKARARRNILTVSGLFAIDSFAGGMIFESFLSLWMVEKFGSSTAEVGLMLVAAQGLNIVSLTLAPTVAARIGLLNTLVFTQVGSNLALIAFAFAPSAWIAVALWMARSLLDEMDVPTRQSYMMGITEPDERPMMAGTANLGRGLGRVGSPVITGALWAGAITAAPWVLAGTLKLVYDAAIYFAFRNVTPPEESAKRTR